MFWLNASVQNWRKCETPVFVSIHYYSHQRSEVNTPPFLAPHHCSPATRNLLKCSSESVICLFGAFFLAAPPVLLHDPTLMSSTDNNSPLHALLQLTFCQLPFTYLFMLLQSHLRALFGVPSVNLVETTVCKMYHIELYPEVVYCWP